MSEETLSSKLRELAAIKRQEKKAKKLHDALTETRVQLEQECFVLMEDQDGLLSSRKLDGVGFRPNRTPYHIIQDEEKFVKWAEENDRSLIAVAAREGLMNQLVRTCLHNGEELPPGVGYYNRDKISISGLGAAAAEDDDDQ